MASLPRPSRPSLNPPSGPLPSIPVPKSRQSSVTSVTQTPPTSYSAPTSLPKPGTIRSPSASSVPTTAPPNKPLPNIPLAGPPSSAAPPTAPASSQTPARTLRKTASYNVFPKPSPGVARPPSLITPPATTSVAPKFSTRTSSLANHISHGKPISPSSDIKLSESAAVVSPVESAAGPHASLPGPEISVEDTADGNDVVDDVAIDDSPRGRPTSITKEKEKGNVVISVRVRPEANSSDGNADAGEWMVDGRRSLVSYRGKEGGDYFYDNVFTTHDKNAKVYDSAAKRLVRRVMEGYHGTVFAYGMTGTGKTFSMQGTATSPGVIPLAITDIFSFIRETPHREFLLRVSYLEIYNEKIHDLLSAPAAVGQAGAAPQEEIKLREDSKRGVYATPLKEEIVQSPTQLLRVIARGDHARRTGSTQYNARSSRSHAVVQIVVESRERAPGPNTKAEKRSGIIPGGVRVSTLSLIDLAGSERAAENKERRTEGAHINKSLLTLGTVISRLSGNKDKQGNPTDKDGKHLPYRDSKLTRLLQSALAGGSLISILCTIQIGSAGSNAAAGSHVGETLNTLKFAARARNNIISHAKKAEEAHANVGDAGSRALLDRYRLEIVDLRKQLESQKMVKEKDKEKDKDDQEEKAKEIEEQNRHEEQMLEMQLARTALKERIEHLNRLILSSKSIGVNASRSFSSLSFARQRHSTASNAESYSGARSVRSSASTQTLDPNRIEAPHRSSSSSLSTLMKRESSGGPYHNVEGEEEEDSVGENGDGTASLTAQVRNLQADLADKTRYISTLEKRLLQARRSSRSRMSMTFANRNSIASGDDGSMETAMQEKDAEIAELRARLDDKDRMLTALKSAARKRDTADSGSPFGDRSNSASPALSPTTDPTSANSSQFNRKHNSMESSLGSGSNRYNRRSSLSTNLSASRNRSYSRNGPASPVGKLMQMGGGGGGSPERERKIRKTHGVDEMTRMLDEMIRQKVESGSGGGGNDAGAANGAGNKRHTVLNGFGGLSSANVDGNGKQRSSTRFSTDAGRLSGWESEVARRRASVMGNSGFNINSTEGSRSANMLPPNPHRSSTMTSSSSTATATPNAVTTVASDNNLGEASKTNSAAVGAAATAPVTAPAPALDDIARPTTAINPSSNSISSTIPSHFRGLGIANGEPVS